MRPFLSVVVPTIGRQSLPDTLASIRRQAIPAEILVVADTFELDPDIRSAITREAARWDARHLEVDAGYHDTGSPQLQAGYAAATAPWIVNCGDDDVYEPLAFLTIKRAITEVGEIVPLMFRTVLHPSPVRGNQQPIVLWQHPTLTNRNITGQCLVLPNRQDKIGRWDILVDFGFITSTIELWEGRVAWRTEVVSQCY